MARPFRAKARAPPFLVFDPSPINQRKVFRMEPHYITPADHISRLLQDPMSTAALIRQVLDSALPLAEVAKGAELLITVEADEPFAFEALADVVIEMPAWSDWITRVAGRFDEGELRYVPISPDPELAEIVAMTPGGYSCVKITHHPRLACLTVRFT